MENHNLRLGLKLWSTNVELIGQVKELFGSGLYSYVELFAVPGTYDKNISQWSNLDIPFVIHAAHFAVGMDLSDPDKAHSNLILIKEAINFANTLSASYVIFHPGVKGTIEETARQLSRIKDPRTLIENVPIYGFNNINIKLLGNTPNEISYLLHNVNNLGFCFDIAHSIFASNSHNLDYWAQISKYIDLKPVVVHLCDGDVTDKFDSHLPLGSGNFPLNSLIKRIPRNSLLTLETDKQKNNFIECAKLDAQIINDNYWLQI